MFRIKICGVTNIDDAHSAADAGADAIGLNFFKKSRRFVAPEIAREIAASLPAAVTKVGVFVNHSADQIAAIVDQVGLDCIQLHGDESPTIVPQLPAIPIVRATRSGGGLKALIDYLEVCRHVGRVPEAVLIDAASAADYGGTGRVANWAAIAAERLSLAETPLILAGGLTPENVAAAIAAVRPDGVDVATGVEREPGRKDAALVAQFIAEARAAFHRA